MLRKLVISIVILGLALWENLYPALGSAIAGTVSMDDFQLFLPFLGLPAIPDYKIAFISDRDGSNDLYMMNSDGTHIRQITNDDLDETYVIWSPDGKKLLYCVYDATSSPSFLYYLLDLETMSVSPFSFDPVFALKPDWSPDGAKISFSGGPPGSGPPGIYVMDMDGSHSLRLTSYVQNSTLPRWSRDGNWIVYVAEDETGYWLMKIRPDGSQATPLTGIEIDPGLPVWSEDDTKIAFIKDDANHNDCAYILEVDTLKQDPLWCPDTWIGSLDWSADGNRILLTQSSHGASDILALDLTTGAPISLTNDAYWDFYARWSPVKVP